MGLVTASVLTEGRTPSQLRDSGGLGDSLTALSSFGHWQGQWVRHPHYGCCSQGIQSDPMAWTPWQPKALAFCSATCLLG